MKGIVFTELMDMIVSRFGENMWDDVIDDCDLKSKGVYTASGTYDHTELLQIVSHISKRTNVSVRDLVVVYGTHLFGRFFILMPEFFESPQTVFDFLESVDDYIHVEVKKLYPDAQLPRFETKRIEAGVFEMTYQSVCPFADFAKGLIEGCIDHYSEDITLTYIDQNTDGQYKRVFTLVRNDV